MARHLISVLLVVMIAAAACGSDAELIDTPVADQDESRQDAVAADSVAAEDAADSADQADGLDTAGEVVGSGEQLDRSTTIGGVNMSELFPFVVDVEATLTSGDSWRFDVTLSSEYDSPERYADAWRVVDADDNELGIRVLTHDHANEQPFTRSGDVVVPSDVTTVFVEGRDLANGWSSERYPVELER